MKKYLLFLGLAFTINLNAQMLYKLTHSTGTYNALSTGTDVTYSAWDSSFTVTLPFSFRFFDHPYNNLKITYDGVFFTDTGVDYIFYGTDEFMPEGMDYSKSPIKFDIIGNPPNRIVKVEYKNIREFNSDTTFDYYLNNQIWLYESDNSIEYRFGPSSITDPNYTEFFIGLIDEDNSPYYAIDSTAANPSLVRVLNAGAFNGIPSYPVNGQIYKLSPSNWSSIHSNIILPYSFRQVDNGFVITSKSSVKMEVFDLTGRAVASYNYDDVNQAKTIVPALSSGAYVVTISVENQIFTEKIVIN